MKTPSSDNNRVSLRWKEKFEDGGQSVVLSQAMEEMLKRV